MNRFFVFAGDWQLGSANGDSLRGGLYNFFAVDKEGTVDSDKVRAKEVLPLGDARLVPVRFAVAGMDPDFGVAGFYI